MNLTPAIPATILGAPPQPNLKYYALNSIYELGILTAAQAASAGVPNLNDPTQPLKNWADSAAVTPSSEPGDYVIYQTLKAVVNPQTGVAQTVIPPVFVQLPMLASVAGAINLPEAVTYPTWVPAPTVAVETIEMNGGVTTISGVNPAYLSTQEQGQTLMAQLNGSNLQEYVPAPGPGNLQINYGTETRRMWIFTDSNAQMQYVGLLLGIQYAQTVNQNVVTGGVGAPGQWVNSGAGTPFASWIWVPVPATATWPAGAPLVSMPMRSLLANEEWDYASLGQTVMIERTDL